MRFGRKSGSSGVAKALKLVLIHDRARTSPSTIFREAETEDMS